MKVLVAGLLTCLSSIGFAAGNDFNFEVSPTAARVVNAQVISCLSKKIADETGTVPTRDIAESYARFENVRFVFPHLDKALNIFSIEVRIEGLPTGIIKQVIAGDELLALNQVWFDNGEAVVGGPLARRSFKRPGVTYNPAETVINDCSLILGGLPADRSYQAAVTLTAFGFTEDTAGNQTPVHAQATAILINQAN